VNRAGTAACYTLVCRSYRLEMSDGQLETWHELLSHLDGSTALEATRRLCASRRFAPVPAEIIAEADRLAGPSPPPVEVAIGYYLAGRWDAHPLVELVARSVYWDRRVPEGQWEFRHRYAAALHDASEADRDVSRRRISGDSAGIDPHGSLPRLEPPEH
jgi:hypothetical protein